jgi:hypothetical protein
MIRAEINKSFKHLASPSSLDFQYFFLSHHYSHAPNILDCAWCMMQERCAKWSNSSFYALCLGGVGLPPFIEFRGLIAGA